MYCGEICGVNLLLGLLQEISRRITAGMELHALGTMLGVKEYTIASKLRDYSEINEASYKVLVHWRQEGIDKKRGAPEMEKWLKDALCSEHVGMNSTVAELFNEPDEPDGPDQTLL